MDTVFCSIDNASFCVELALGLIQWC